MEIALDIQQSQKGDINCPVVENYLIKLGYCFPNRAIKSRRCGLGGREGGAREGKVRQGEAAVAHVCLMGHSSPTHGLNETRPHP